MMKCLKMYKMLQVTLAVFCVTFILNIAARKDVLGKISEWKLENGQTNEFSSVGTHEQTTTVASVSVTMTTHLTQHDANGVKEFHIPPENPPEKTLFVPLEEIPLLPGSAHAPGDNVIAHEQEVELSYDSLDTEAELNNRRDDTVNKFHQRQVKGIGSNNHKSATDDIKNPGSNDVIRSSGSIMISTYMRSGSSFLGRVLGFRHDAFYMYEPLWGLARDYFFDKNSQKCSTYTPRCVSSNGIAAARKALAQLYNCDLHQAPLSNIFTANINAKLSGSKWENYKSCKSQRRTETACLHLMAKDYCRTSPYKVAKVLRLSLAHMERLLIDMPDLRVVHLFRDPRAMINSHFRTRWSPIQVTTQRKVADGAKAICDRIVTDVKYGDILRKKYPDRFKVIQYEDFEHPLEAIKKIYEFVGMPFSKGVLKFIDNSGDKKSSSNTKSKTAVKTRADGNHPFKYRQTLRWDTVAIINRYCGKAFDLLGYRTFKSQAALRNMSISAVKYLPYKIK